ncbi:MAG: hypothetical protein DI537_23875 [Stutzerimonas stutzeri]|nr:MAG: hypothetical protein DI537_23875 [Stutzerimonas stutzeri]
MSNGFESAERWVKEIERHHETLATYQGEYMARCRPVRESIAGCYDAAKEAGIPRKELKAVIKERRFLKQIEANRAKLEEDEQETLDQIKHALGMLSDLPLGETALKRSAAVDSLTQADDEAAGRENAAKLSAGISKLN